MSLMTIADIEHHLATGAALASQRYASSSGQTQVQVLHDAAARAGAVCHGEDDDDRVLMSVWPELRARQAIHDLATEYGARCNSTNEQRTLSPSDASMDPGHQKADRHDAAWPCRAQTRPGRAVSE